MCTLTYLLTPNGYELFFNRDEQRTRPRAIAPTLDEQLKAIYPVDPLGQGSWIAVHQSGLSLALLNFYQGKQQGMIGAGLSRGEIILRLLNDPNNIVSTLKEMHLTDYGAFQLVVFDKKLSISNEIVRLFQWDGDELIETAVTQPITSSSVDFAEVYQHRQQRFRGTIDADKATREQFLEYQTSQETQGKLSVKMHREDALTVSFSHIVVDKMITFNYCDYINDSQQKLNCIRLS